MRIFYLIELPLRDGITRIEIVERENVLQARTAAKKFSLLWEAVVVVAEHDSYITLKGKL